MKLIIAGSRTINLSSATILGFCMFFEISLGRDLKIISGGAKGVDHCAENFAKTYTVHSEVFPADWNRHGLRAGVLRNAEMAAYADALLLIWDGKSKGSANMKANMERLKKPIYEVILK